MDKNLRRVFDQTRPSPEQKQAMLSRLLKADKEEVSVRHVKRAIILGLATALMVFSCAAAVVTGIDQQLAEYFRVKPDQLEKLVYGTVSEDNRHTYDNGWTVEIKQAVADSWMLDVLVEVTAPEGTVFAPNSHFEGRIILPGDLDQEIGALGVTTLLEDEDPNDTRVTLIWHFDRSDYEPSYMGQTVYIKPGFFSVREGEGVRNAYSGNIEIEMYWETWRCGITLPEQDPGISRSIGQSFHISGAEVSLTHIYLSPLSFTFRLEEGPDPLFVLGSPSCFYVADIKKNWKDEVYLTMSDGEKVYMADCVRGGATKSGNAKQKGVYSFKLPERIDPKRAVSFTLFGQTYELN